MIYELLEKYEADFFVMYADSRDPNFFYATKFRTPDPSFYMIGKDGTELLIVSEMELRRAEKESRVKEIASFIDLRYFEKLNETKNSKKALAMVFTEALKEHRARKILIPNEFPSFLSFYLKDHFEIEVVENPYSDMRAVKSPEEIRYIKEACSAVIDAFEYFLKLLKSERNVNTLRNRVETFLFERGFYAEGTIVSPDLESSNPHSIGSGVIKNHVVFDVFPKSRVTGYFADFTRTVIIEENQDIIEMLNACIEAKNRAIDKIREGVAAKDIHNLVCDILESYGYQTIRNKAKEGFIHSTGHGVGLEVHEKPKISENDEKLKSGMVITIEPGLYYRSKGGVRVEDCVVVRKSGCEVLTKYEDFVRLVG